MSDEANHAEPDLPLGTDPVTSPAGAPIESVPAHSVEKTYHVSERISLSFLIAATVLFSVIFSALRAIDAPYEMYIAIISLVTLTALSQALFGKAPRMASTMAGIITLVPWFLISSFANLETDARLAALFCALPIVTAFSAVVGYLAGALAAGIILVLDKIERREK